MRYNSHSSALLILLGSLAAAVSGTGILYTDRYSLAQRVLQISSPYVDYYRNANNQLELAFNNFPNPVEAPNNPNTLAIFPSLLNGTQNDVLVNFDGNNSTRYNSVPLLLPNDIREIQIRFGQNIMFPLAFIVPNGSSLNYELIDSNMTSRKILRFSNAQVLGPMTGAMNISQTVAYTGLGTAAFQNPDATSLGMYNVTYRVPNGTNLTNAVLFLYSPIRYNNASNLTLTLNASNVYLNGDGTVYNGSVVVTNTTTNQTTNQTTNNTTNNTKTDSGSSKTGLILGLVLGLGIPFLLLLGFLLWWFCCRNRRNTATDTTTVPRPAQPVPQTPVVLTNNAPRPLLQDPNEAVFLNNPRAPVGADKTGAINTQNYHTLETQPARPGSYNTLETLPPSTRTYNTLDSVPPVPKSNPNAVNEVRLSSVNYDTYSHDHVYKTTTNNIIPTIVGDSISGNNQVVAGANDNFFDNPAPVYGSATGNGNPPPYALRAGARPNPTITTTTTTERITRPN